MDKIMKVIPSRVARSPEEDEAIGFNRRDGLICSCGHILSHHKSGQDEGCMHTNCQCDEGIEDILYIFIVLQDRLIERYREALSK